MRFRNTGRRAVVLIAATYIYFLIFAQFSFLKRLAELGLADAHLKQVMGAMALGGVASSLVAVRWVGRVRPVLLLRGALGGCALPAALTALSLPLWGAIAVALGIGTSLGLLTVTLVANLRLWTGRGAGAGDPLLRVGLGTGLGYFVCNLPPVFTAGPAHLGLFAAAVCCVALVAAGDPAEVAGEDQPVAQASLFPVPLYSMRLFPALPFPVLLAWFTALIWFDSAAFFIIQNAHVLKAGTQNSSWNGIWEGTAHLWRNGALHLAAALGSAVLLRRRGLAPVLLLAFGCLAGACLLLLVPAYAPFAALLYPAGVSFYSVALVAYPSFLLQTSSATERTRKAGLIYAVAGWIGSALGIGMAQNLHRVPPAFIAGATVLFLLPVAWRYRGARLREATAVAGVAVFSFLLVHAVPKPVGAQTAVSRGKQVYIAEGCIHCHSQYVRPHTEDVLLWGPAAANIDAIRKQQPPLIGNRRQGPDLSEVGSRRSPLWLRMHFFNPRIVNPGSIMPSYRYLFTEPQGDRGEDLLAYVESLQSAGSPAHLRATAASWQPHPAPDSQAEAPAVGARLFADYCATCHDAHGRARTQWGSSFHRLPPLLAGQYRPGADGVLPLERLIKFGLPGTDMPGHEYFSDDEVAVIARYVAGAL